MIIKDPNGKALAVDDNNRAQTFSITENVFTDVSVDKEDAYSFATGHQAITTADTFFGMLYIKNTSSTKKFYVKTIRSCGSKENQWTLYRNPTAGTLISGATAASEGNMNFSSNKSAEMVAYSGGEGITLTDGTAISQWINDIGHSTEDYDGAIVLGKNDSLALKGNSVTAGDLCANIFGWFQ